MANYYNEFDPFAAAWLRELIKDGLIADGVVDERSICDVQPEELTEFTQCHFFAGIGGWSYALRLADWPDSRPVWTGSPPCQPFSVAGKREGKDDARHLWPVFFNLISKCRPPTIFGEQVAASIREGWFDDLQADLAKENYASAMAVLPACSVGAPHKRDRLFFVAHSFGNGLQRGVSRWPDSQRETERGSVGCGSSIDAVGNAERMGRQPGAGEGGLGRERSTSEQGGGSLWSDTSDGSAHGVRAVYCKDGKYRPIPTEPALFPLANGIPNRMGVLRGAGNAIVPQVAAQMIRAFTC